MSHGGGQEQRQPLASSQVGPGVGSQPLHERACAPGTHMPGTCASVLCLFLQAVHTPVCTPARLSVHTDAHTSVHQTHHHAHTSCTHTPSRTHTPSHPHAHTRHHTHPLTHTHTSHTHELARTHAITHTHSCTHTHACTHCRVCILQVVLRGLALLFLGRKTAPPGLQDTKEPHHMPTVPGTSTQFRRLFSSGRVLTVPFSS